MNKLLIASIIATAAMLSQSSAQSINERDSAIAQLTDDRDMSTGLAHSAPNYVWRSSTSTASSVRADAKVHRVDDQSTSLNNDSTQMSIGK